MAKNKYQIEIKTKNVSHIVYSKGYVVINANYMIAKEYVQLDDTLMQDKINNDIEFQWDDISKHFNDKVPPIENIIPVFDSTYTPLQDTNLLLEVGKKETAKIFYNPDKKYLTYMNQDYFNLVNNCVSILKDFRQSEKYNNICIFDSNCKLLFLVMPMQVRDSFFYDHYMYAKESRELLGKVEELAQYQIV